MPVLHALEAQPPRAAKAPASASGAAATPRRPAGAGAPRPRAGRRRWQSRSPRAIHLLDPENLIGTGAPHLIQVRLLMDRYAARVGIGPMDQIVIGCCHLAFKTIGFCWPGPDYRVRSGPDGADLELLDVIRHEQVASRFAEVVIGSGDGAFTPAAAALASSGCRVTVVSRLGHLSRTLELAAGRRVIYIDGTPEPDRRQCAA
jgi:hypothetical protein